MAKPAKRVASSSSPGARRKRRPKPVAPASAPPRRTAAAKAKLDAQTGRDGYWRPSVTTDVVVFRIAGGELRVLLIKRRNAPFANAWAIPGGFVEPDETLEAGARRELAEETGVTRGYLEQLYSFGDPGRDPRGRVITVAYLALWPSHQPVQARAGDDAAEAAWHPVKQLPKLAFDHAKILRYALDRLRGKMEYTTIAFNLLPAKFTMSELRLVYEIVWERELDPRNFRKLMLARGLLEPLDEKATGKHRPAQLYRFTKQKFLL